MTIAQIAEWAPLVGQIGFPVVVAFILLTRFDTRLSNIEHRLVGLQRVLLIELLSRESLSIMSKTMAREELDKLNAPNKK